MLAAQLRKVNGCDEFVIRTDVSAYLEALVGLGYGVVGQDEDEYLRRFPESPSAAAIFDRFASHLRPLLDQACRWRVAPWSEALELVCERATEANLDWFLYGSASLALRGLAIEPRDIDLVIPDHATALSLFGDLLIQPPLFHADTYFVSSWSERAFAGARIEWVSAVHPTLDGWLWPNEIGGYAQTHLEEVRWRDWSVRVPPLALQLAAAEERQLANRADAIRAFADRDAAAIRWSGRQ